MTFIFNAQLVLHLNEEAMPTERDGLGSGGQDLGGAGECLESGSVACQSLP